MDHLRQRKNAKNKQKAKNAEKIEDISEFESENENTEDVIASKEEITNKQMEETKERNEQDKWITTCTIKFELDFIAIVLFVCALATRMYKLDEPKNVV